MIPVSKIQRLSVQPDELLLISGAIPVQLQARFLLTNGSSALLNAIAHVNWSSSNESIVTVNRDGFVTGIHPGIAVIYVECQGFTDEMDIEVVANPSEVTLHGNTWTATPLDTVIVLDRSASMLQRDNEGVSRVERARRASLFMMANLTDSESQVALVTFAGLRIPGETISDPAITEADADLELTLTTDRREVRDALNHYKVVQPTTILGGKGTIGATGIGAALEVARAELLSERHQFGNKRLIVLFTDGLESVNKPSPLQLADDIKFEGTLISLVALDVSDSSTLEALASPDLFFTSPTVFELSFEMSKIPWTVGYYETGYGFYA